MKFKASNWKRTNRICISWLIGFAKIPARDFFLAQSDAAAGRAGSVSLVIKPSLKPPYKTRGLEEAKEEGDKGFTALTV